MVVIGCGAVGLPLAAALARQGRRVLGVDVDERRVAELAQGRCNLVDEGLKEALNAALSEDALAFSAVLSTAGHPRVFIIAAPTRASAEAGFESGPLDAAVASVIAAARDGDLVCIRSTVPIGTTRSLAESAGGRPLRWAACPDRSLSGCALADQFRTPHLVGGLGAEAGARAAELFASLGPVVRVADPETAEAIKLFANVSRDATFALANQFALICEATGVDIGAVRSAGAEGYDRFQLTRPGPVGGPCLTKDVHVLAASPAMAGLDISLLTAARAVNDSLAPGLAREIVARLGSSRGPVAVLGLGFKGVPATLDQRRGFGGELAKALAAEQPDLEIRTWDPVEAPDDAARDTVLRGAKVVVLANDHPALAAAVRRLPELAPDAMVHDLAGVAKSTPGVVIKRFGDGR